MNRFADSILENLRNTLAAIDPGEFDRVCALLTDQWGSSVTGHARHKFNCRIEVPPARDSNVAILSLIETMIAQVQQATWGTSAKRMQELEKLFDKTRLYRKFQ